jgi:HSP20 family molecular chaperone IbpA
LATGAAGANFSRRLGRCSNEDLDKGEMDDIRSIQLRRLHSRLGEVAYELTRVQFTRFSSEEHWAPAINAYRCSESVVLCLDLAGVDQHQLEIQVESRRLLIRGRRQPPEPERAEHKPVQVLLMEIDHGPFEREIQLPCDVSAESVTFEQRNGLLWIYIRVRCQG